jgi:tRNA-specific 2-thiouridylase
MEKNEVYVTTNLSDETLWKKTVVLSSVHWINDMPADGAYDIRVRHRAPLVKARFEAASSSLSLDDSVRAVAAGQSIVIYDGDVCLGGGIVAA